MAIRLCMVRWWGSGIVSSVSPKKTLIALLNELPVQELHLQSRYNMDEEDTSATSSFLQELGRASSNVGITRPLQRQYRLLHLKKILPQNFRKPNPPPSTTATQSIPFPRTSHIATQHRFPMNEESVTWKRRQEIMQQADYGQQSILSEIDTIHMCRSISR